MSAMEECPDTSEAEPDLIDEAEYDRLVELSKKPSRWPPLYRAVEGVNVIDLSVVPFPSIVPAHRRVLIMVLQLAVKDRASEIRFEPYRSDEGDLGVGLLYQVDGQLLELVPPPYWVAAPMMSDIEDAAGFCTLRRRVADLFRRLARRIDGQSPNWESGRFRLRVGENHLDAQLWAYPSELGKRLFIHLPPISPEVSDEAWRHLKTMISLMQKPIAPGQVTMNVPGVP